MGLGSSSIAARVGAICAPYVVFTVSMKTRMAIVMPSDHRLRVCDPKYKQEPDHESMTSYDSMMTSHDT